VAEDLQALGLATAVIWPRALLAPDVLDSYRNHLTGLRQVRLPSPRSSRLHSRSRFPRPVARGPWSERPC